ncbi:serine hydrolase domain-containing protein [Flagellimonas meishanensis]|uniref:serine hydrolase domain-containing protein n=1 Tax=Flagellimonas meishanensis TaxID=2873264 RepID=UPI001CA72153|nr:serine hydrolase domain-containing protein [[Muricauda] meishanensis]
MDFFNGAIIVTEGDSIVLSRGYGYANFELQIPFETTTSMDTGSITKTFTALTMLMLADSKEIDLNTPVNSFIGEFPYPSITIRHLLEQTSGIVSDDYVFESAQQNEPITNGTFLDFLVQNAPELEFSPGSQFMYNGFNHRLLALLIEQIGDTSYEEFIERNIALPLGLNDWFLRPALLKDLPKNRAVGYRKEKDTLQAFDSEDFEAFYGDCNLFFSAEDLSKWSRSFLSNSLYPKHSSAMAFESKGSLSEFNILHWYNPDGQRTYHFTGDWKGFYTMIYFDIDKKRSIVHLTNTNMDYWLRPAIVRNVNHYLNDGSLPDWQKAQPLEFINEEITGSYYFDENQVAQISYDNRTLEIEVNGKSFGLFRLDSGFYYAPGADLWIWFSKDDGENLTIHCSSIYKLSKGFKKDSQYGL